jgi:hypothetical protein
MLATVSLAQQALLWESIQRSRTGDQAPDRRQQHRTCSKSKAKATTGDLGQARSAAPAVRTKTRRRRSIGSRPTCTNRTKQQASSGNTHIHQASSGTTPFCISIQSLQFPMNKSYLGRKPKYKTLFCLTMEPVLLPIFHLIVRASTRG